MIKNKKRELTEEQKKELFQSGERFAEKIKLKEKIDAVNEFGNKKPKLMFSIIFSAIIGLLVIGYLFPLSNKTNTQPIDIKQLPIEKTSTSEKDFQDEMFAIYTEMEMITDTLLKMIDKKNISSEDSVFMVKQYTRLEELNKIINYELNLE